MRIDRREQDGLRADGAIVAAAAPDARPDLYDLTGPTVVAGDLAAIDDVGIQRIGSDVAVFLDSDRVPLAERDPALVTAALRRTPSRFPAVHRRRDTGNALSVLT